MQVLLIQFVDPRSTDPQPRFSHSLGVLAAMLRQEGFDPALLTVGQFRPDALREAVIRHRPKHVLAELPSLAIASARRTLGEVAGHYALPVTAFGSFATLLPKRALSFPGVRCIAVGEYEQTVMDCLGRLRAGEDPAGVPGAWVHGDDGPVKGPVRPLVEDLDALPWPDRELFGYQRHVERTGRAEFKVARGCPLWCGFCINDWYMDLYGEGAPFVRRRSVEDVLAEVEDTRRRYPQTRSVGFYDHAFAMDLDWLGRLAEEYPRRVGLPIACHVRLKRVCPETARLLAMAGATEVHTALPSGSRFIREEIQTMPISDKQVVEGVRVLRAAGLRVVAEVYVGNPYESEITLGDTLKLIERAAPDEVHPRVYYPAPGTRAAEVCRENGWVSGRGETEYWANRSVLDMPSMSAEQINEAARKLQAVTRRRRGALGQWICRLLSPR